MKLSGFGWAALALVVGFFLVGMSRCQHYDRWYPTDPRLVPVDTSKIKSEATCTIGVGVGVVGNTLVGMGVAR